jgi:hypothetical protein
MMNRNYNSRAPSTVLMDRLGPLLDQIDPDSDYCNWIKVLMAVFHETYGHEAGFKLVDAWSSHGDKYKGEADVWRYWRALRRDHRTPLTIGTLKWMAKRAD